ncbi:MAG: dihydrofolate reductase [Rhizobiaceae bacterium]|nr:dihydrofolate reductase [Rhizobiaceae bacterium]
MRIVFYVAIASNGVIGFEGDLPWRLSSDLKRFKAQTMGKPLIMGRKTWESLPRKPLPGRLNIVVTRSLDFVADGATVAHSADEALAVAERSGAAEAAVIGGGELFRMLFDRADTLNVTHVLGEVAGDTFFPPISPTHWEVVESADYPAGENDSHATRHVIYDRIAV